MITIDVKHVYGEVAKLDKLPEYVAKAKEMAGKGNDVVLTGQGPGMAVPCYSPRPSRPGQKAGIRFAGNRPSGHF